MVHNDWLLGVRVVTTAVLHLHVPGWSFGGCLNFFCVAVDCVGVVLACDGSLVLQSSLLGGGEGLGNTHCFSV